MKTTLRLVSFLAAIALWPATQSKAAEVSFDFFYDNLDPYGDWVEVGDYGYCWHPRDIDEDWHPYTTGNWAYTDAGWTWVSDEPYGWAVYHYGRWSRVERVGWVWVPDTEWAPAWVSWRKSDRYVGWAPLPPESRARVGVSIGGWVDAAFDIGPTYYSFVDVRNLGAPRLRSVLLPPSENITIINQTTNITNITYRNNVVINNGPNYDVVAREVEQPIRRLKLERRREIADLRTARSEQLGAKVQGESLVVAAPTIQKASGAKPKKVAQRLEKTEIDRGWKNAGDSKQVETARAKIKEEAKGAPEIAARERIPGAAPAESTTQPKVERPSTVQETTTPVPESETTTKPGKGKARDRRGIAAEPGAPARPGEPATTTNETAPQKAGTAEQRGVASETEEPVRGGKQRGKKAAGQTKSPEAIAEDVQPPAERGTESKPQRHESPTEAERPNRRQAAGDADVKKRGKRGAPEVEPSLPEREIPRERQAQPERPNVNEKAERSATEQLPARGSGGGREARGQQPERMESPQPQPNRPPQTNVQGRGPGAGKAPNPEGERKKKKGDREPEQ
jgi:hypothetical protein